MAQAIASRARKAVVKALESECWQLREGARRYLGQRKVVRPSIVNKRSSDILHDPWYNKGTAFPLTERERLGLRGMLPPRVMSINQQIDRFMANFRSLERNTRDGPQEVAALAKWRILNRLHDRNETLFYKILIDNIQQLAPIVYTPTVGLVCQNYSGLFRRPRGMYFSAADRGEMMSMIYNWPAEQVDMIVVTDGSRILGLGDLGVQGIGIPIGKLDLYVAAAGMNPQRVLPVMIDVGTNNQQLLDNPLYMGLHRPRLEGEEYMSIIDEFMEAAFTRYPDVIVQFEDFQSKWAFKLLQRYRTHYRMFNDDIQGTAGVALAGVLGAVRAQGRPMSDIAKQKIVVVGAGSAGLGVVSFMKQAVARVVGNDSPQVQGSDNFWLVDKDGLVTEARENIDPDAKQYARSLDDISRSGLQEGASLVDVVRHVKPDVLMGLSAVGGLFTQEVLEAMKLSDCPRPAILPMSNPTSKAECTAEQAFKYVGPHIVFASGSPFQDVDLGDGKIGRVNQGNNMYLFPGIGLGALLSGAHHITDGMLHAAAECLASVMDEESLQKGIIYPPIPEIRNITAKIAEAVIKEAIIEEVAEGYRETDPRELQAMAQDDSILAYVEKNMWSPEYSSLVYES
ncbi:malate dehydrogenase (oxaloacetate-decarboxylating)(NADP+) [Marchantia polymorpha subsp. ruderalis]|uniref:Malic enzyme n=2 Tax=Marchantia polymorpha TaxID=3197 RepID=A0A176W3M0_MARPO|nr:hypothetical protein AXG93_473s1040 [Marchantia polymorpha subsp. ruderalis]PTQ34456.1 hypothetical protein MARPO_0080s0072 [Marchantia polymorpha]PTQ34457.1 hypothetical protein MARPO_0080s0072 [Marchantia polymorpha]BBN07248.1 hypothetical protein Mp_4g02270 [Marchantia polymorpha subsp. ruderalis]BBN07249.1 hypothetical protein Mp_4g02270 [Marchantia polymorpha subsp. ruderalis]|eukprot:PTQ34456.1 hypothetical protein MARPO_0080s0072 [Marchantia polymorpha]